MSKGGYNKLLTKLQEANAEILSLRSRAMERDQEILELQREAESNPSEFPVESDTVQREWQVPLNRIDSIHLFLGLVGMFFTLITPAVWHKVPGLALMYFGFGYLIWRSTLTQRLNELLRVVLIAVILGGISYAVVPQLVNEWRIEHMRSELKFNASAPGFSFPTGDHEGIQWEANYSEVRLAITSGPNFPIATLNLSIGVTEDRGAIAGMVDTEPQGCGAIKPKENLIRPLVFKGLDGSRADISPLMNDDINKIVPYRDHYDLSCGRIEQGETIPLIIATLTPKANSPLSSLRITGYYETTAIEGSKRVPVDETVSISKPRPWK